MLAVLQTLRQLAAFGEGRFNAIEKCNTVERVRHRGVTTPLWASGLTSVFLQVVTMHQKPEVLSIHIRGQRGSGHGGVVSQQFGDIAFFKISDARLFGA